MEFLKAAGSGDTEIRSVDYEWTMIFLIGIIVSFFCRSRQTRLRRMAARARRVFFALPLTTNARYLSAMHRAAVEVLGTSIQNVRA